MRHFEYVGGTSEKFWEIEQDGTSVTVRFGRIGTAGQTQVKDLDSEAKAAGHLAKLVAEKVKKGYVEGGAVTAPPKPAPAPTATPAAAATATPAAPASAPTPTAAPTPVPAAPGEPEPDLDEDAWTVPAGWWRQTEPFRSLGPVRPAPFDETAPEVVARLQDVARKRLVQVLDDPDSDEDLVRPARRFLGEPSGFLRRAQPEADPVGAAVVAAVVAMSVDWTRRSTISAFADAWALAHGIPFAAEAGAHLAGVDVRDPRHSYSYGVGSQTRVVVTPTAPDRINTYLGDPVLQRLRSLLAGAGDADYAAAVRRLTEVRSGPIGGRLAASYLAPTEQHWVDDDIDYIRSAGISAPNLAMLMASATTADQATAILDAAGTWTTVTRPSLLYTMAAAIGSDVATILMSCFDGSDADGQKRTVSMTAHLPTDEAFGLLLQRLDQKYVQPAVLEAMARFPRRALRLLAGSAGGTGPKATIAKELLRGHAISHPTLADRVRPELDPSATRTLDALAAAMVVVPDAPDDHLPAVLVTPPWDARRPRPKPVVVEGLGPPSGLRLAWKPGEREDWATTNLGYGWNLSKTSDWAKLLNDVLAGREWRGLAILAHAPADLVGPFLRRYTPGHIWNATPMLKRILGRVGDDATVFIVRIAMERPASLAALLLPIEGSAVATHMAEWYATSKSIRPVALAWFDRHPTAAARDLVPAALAKPGKARATAEAALRVLGQRGHGDAVRVAAEAYGVEAAAAVDATLALDPLQLLPPRVPALPSWLDVSHLPQVLLPDRASALPRPAVAHLCTMLAMSKAGDTYAGVELVRDAVDPASLAEMAWGLFERWRGAGYPSKDGWVLEALGLLGDDETVRRLAPLIRAWPGESAHTRAVAGLDVLSAIGTDVALMHLHGISEKAKFKGLKTKAKAKMDEVADGLGLTAEQLADRLVPDFGLEHDGALVLDYGARRFRVGFDEQLKPVVADDDGARRKVLPKPAAKDDPTLAPAAYALFTGLKKDVKAIAADQIRRFEQAMVRGRRWTAAEQRALFVEHPLLWHLARRLVWATFDERGQPTGSFRVAEDRSLADSSDEELNVEDDARVGIAHPLHLAGDLPAWSDVFADYEILQPFAQLGREVLALTEAERDARVLTRLAGVKVPTGKILGLSHRGWERGMPQDAGITAVTFKPVAQGRSVVIDLDPGIIAGDAMEWPEQTIAGIWLDDGHPDWGNANGNLPFGLLDPITASEALRDIEALRP